MVNVDDRHSRFSSAICSICHKDLDPFADDLQAIFVCGHVFHEFCLQEAFGFFESVKRYACPVCNQRCSPNDAARLYFESVSPETPRILILPPPAVVIGDDSEALRQEVKELKEELCICKEQAKKEVISLKNELHLSKEQAKKEAVSLKDELSLCKEQARKVVLNLKNEALNEQASIRQMLHMKTEALDKLTVECLRQQERNRGLTKDLASFKLTTDLDLDEKDVLDLASSGSGGNNEDTIAILRKSLVFSNRNCKELLTRCNILERGEARLRKKLEKAKGKIDRLNMKVHNLTEQCNLLKLDEAQFSRKLDKTTGKIHKLKTKIQFLKDKCNLIELGQVRHRRKLEEAKEKIKNLKARVQEFDGAGEVKKETSVLGQSDILESTVRLTVSCNDAATVHAENIAEVPIRDDVKQVQSTFNIKEESPVIESLARPDAAFLGDLKPVQPMLHRSKESITTEPLPQPASTYFSGGLVGPDGTKRFLGKWCKRREDNQLATTKDSSKDASCSIIDVSDDEDSTENAPQTKRFKYEDKSKIVQSQGFLQYKNSLEGFRGAPIDLD